VLRKILWPKSEGTNKNLEKMVLGGVSRCVLLIRCSCDQMRRVRMTEHVACLWEEGSAYRFLVEKSGGKRPPRGPGWRWEDKNKRNLKEIGRMGVHGMD